MVETLKNLALKVVPLLGVIGVGYWLGKKYDKLADRISNILIYALLPLLVISKIPQAESKQLAIIPALLFIFAALMTIPAFIAKDKLDTDLDKRLLASSFSFFNIAFFGTPIVSAVFSKEDTATMIAAYAGCALYGDTIGYFFVARTKMPTREAILKVLKIPLLYAFLLAFGLAIAGWQPSETVKTASTGLGWVVSVLGMSIIGFNLSLNQLNEIPYKKLSKVIGVRQLSAAILFAGLLLLEAVLIGKLEVKEQAIVGLIALFPIAATVTVFATLIDTQRKEASALVAWSNVVSLGLAIIGGLILSASGIGSE